MRQGTTSGQMFKLIDSLRVNPNTTTKQNFKDSALLHNNKCWTEYNDYQVKDLNELTDYHVVK